MSFIKEGAAGKRFKFTRLGGGEKEIKLNFTQWTLLRVEIDGPDEGENVISTTQSFPICFPSTFFALQSTRPLQGKTS